MIRRYIEIPFDLPKQVAVIIVDGEPRLRISQHLLDQPVAMRVHTALNTVSTLLCDEMGSLREPEPQGAASPTVHEWTPEH